MLNIDRSDASRYLIDPGPKKPVSGQRAVVSAQSAPVAETMLGILDAGGNAADAAVAGSLVRGVVDHLYTNHAATVTLLYWDAKTKTAHSLNATGTIPHELPPFQPVPDVGHGFTNFVRPIASIPGFMPGLNALHNRFGSTPWANLCDDAIYWAEEGYVMNSYLYANHVTQWPFRLYFPDGREMHLPDNGKLPAVGQRFRNPALARTMRNLQSEGPECFTTGSWAREYVKTANEMGWPISLDHMTAMSPDWGDPFRFKHKDFEVLQLHPPQSQGVICCLAMGILEHLGIAQIDPLSAKWIHTMAHVLRWVSKEVTYFNDPTVFNVPLDVWTDSQYHEYVARVIGGSRPKVDLTSHMELSIGKLGLHSAGLPLGHDVDPGTKYPTGSCEFSVVDKDGNWVQSMNTMQSGGLPGKVVGGVPMLGSHADIGGMGLWSSHWLVEGSRTRSSIGNTLLLKEGEPVLSLGSPGNVYCSIPQMLSLILDSGLSPPEASDKPRMIPMAEDCSIGIEGRLPEKTIAELAQMGSLVRAAKPWDPWTGVFQMAWRDADTGLLGACTDTRFFGAVGGIEE